MSRFLPVSILILGFLAMPANGDAPLAVHREARAKAMVQDGAGLVDESGWLRAEQRHFLPPLSSFELEQLFEDDGSKPGVQKIGIVRNLTSPVALRGGALDRAAKRGAGATLLGGGRLNRLADGRAVWTTSVSSPGAESIRIRFDNLSLPDNSRLYVYSEAERYGPYTRAFVAKVTLGVHPFWSHTIQGPLAYVEVQLDDPFAELELTIDGVGHFESAELQAETEALVDCFIETACADDDVNLVKALGTATAQLRYRDGASFYVCTGALVNVSATPQFEPYLLTANHCFSSQTSASSLEAWWDYRTPTCLGAVPSKVDLPKVVGSTLLATDSSSDFTFVELSSSPAGSPFADGARYYLGWTASRPPANSVLYRASHPNGGQQGWSRTVVWNAGTQTCSALPEARFIYSTGNLGGTTGGSSGAPATNASGQIVGQNYGKCGTDLSDPCNYAGARTVDGAFATTYPFIEKWLRPPVPGVPCDVGVSAICLQSGRFEVKLSATDPRTGKTDSGYVMSSSNVFGTFAFPVLAGNQTDPQVFVKVLDGRPINGKWWVFYASLTDVEFDLAVRDTQSGITKTYRQAPYTQESKNDTSAFGD
jgi:lysyl endopeptidase